MVSNSFFKIFIFALLAGFLTAFAFAASIEGKFDPFFLLGVVPIETGGVFMVGILSGALLSLWGYFCLWDKKLFVILPLLYGSSFLITVLLNLIGASFKLQGL